MNLIMFKISRKNIKKDVNANVEKKPKVDDGMIYFLLFFTEIWFN